MTSMGFEPFLDAILSLLGCGLIPRKKQSQPVISFCHGMSVNDLQFSFELIFVAIAEKLGEIFWAILKKTFLHLRENDWRFSVLIVQILEMFKLFGDEKKMREWNQRFYSCVIYRLLVATNQWKSDCREQMLRLDTNHWALIRDPKVRLTYWLASRHGEMSLEH